MNGFASIIFTLLLLFSVVPVQAGLLMGDYLKLKNNQGFGALYLQGFLDGTGFSNAALQNDNRQTAYCEPGKSVLNVDNLKDIVDTYYKKYSEKFKSEFQKDINDFSFGAVAIMTLREAFPCKP